MNYAKWIAHFTRNRSHRPEPDWSSPLPSDVNIPAALVRSIEQFRLGDGGGPASLIAYDAERFRGRTEEMRVIVDMWFAEEAGHARLLGCAVKRLNGRFIHSHWSFSAFCLCRRALGVRFELQVLLLTELVSTAYYRLLRHHSPDGALAAMCELILRDEAGHVAFHRDRLADNEEKWSGIRGLFWRTQFWILGYAAATMLWINHRLGLKSIGATDAEFYLEVGRQLHGFIYSLQHTSPPVRIKAKWAAAAVPN